MIRGIVLGCELLKDWNKLTVCFNQVPYQIRIEVEPLAGYHLVKPDSWSTNGMIVAFHDAGDGEILKTDMTLSSN